MDGQLTRRGFMAAAAGLIASAALAGCSASEGQGHAGGPSAEEGIAGAMGAAGARDTKGSSIIFINPSQNPNGNTARMGRTLLDGMEYETVNLIDYRIYPLGAKFPDDQFEEVWGKMLAAETIVWGTPIYWHAMSGALKVLIDRMYDYQNGELEGKRLAFFQQGGAPRQDTLEMNDYIIGRVAALYGMELLGISDSSDGIAALRQAIQAAQGA